jgi:aspartate/methionine/tyrosine aminotransferase
VANEDVLRTINKIMVHQLYSPPTVTQMMMVEPVKTRSSWNAKFVRHFCDIRDMFVENLKISPRVPEGTYYFFLPITEYLRGRHYGDVINACLDAGVAVAPGEDFGKDYAEWIRLCFTGEPPERGEIAIRRLNEILP